MNDDQSFGSEDLEKMQQEPESRTSFFLTAALLIAAMLLVIASVVAHGLVFFGFWM